MALEVNGKTYETDDNGNLTDPTAWDEDVARAIAAADDTMGELTQEHIDVLNYLRDEYFNNNNNQPMERQINKDMGKIWGKKLSSKDLYKLFPGAPPACRTSRARADTDKTVFRAQARGCTNKAAFGLLFLCRPGTPPQWRPADPATGGMNRAGNNDN